MDYQIGAVRLNQRSAQLLKDGQPLRCEPKVYALLLYFCQQAERAISREELIEHVWQGRIVSDAAVNRVVAELRKVLEPDPKQPAFLLTVSKLGYQLTGVQPCIEQQPAAAVKPKLSSLWFVLPLAGLMLLCVLAVMVWPRGALEHQLSNAEPVTRLSGESFKAVWQEDAQRLWFLHRPTPQEPVQLWQQQGSAAQAVTADRFFYLDFVLIDAEKAIAVRWNNPQQRLCELVWLDLATGLSQPFAPCPAASANQLAYSQKTGWLFFNERPDISSPYALHAIHLASGKRRQLTQPVAAGNGSGDYLFALSASTNQLLVLEYQDGKTVLLKWLDVEGRVVQQKPLALAPTSVLWLAPEQLVLTTMQGVYWLDLASFNLQQLKQEPGWSRFRLAEQGRLLAERFDRLSRIEAQSFSGEPLAFYTQPPGRYSMPALSSDGRLAYVSGETPEIRLLLQQKGRMAESLPLPEPLFYVSALNWSADGQDLLLAANDKLYLYQAGQWQQLVTEFKQVHYAVFATDGAVLFSALHQGLWRLFRLELTKRQPELLPVPEGYTAQGPDSQGFYYYTAFSRPGLFRWRQDAAAEMVLADFPVQSWRDWQLQGQQLLFNQNGHWQLQHLPDGSLQHLAATGQQCRLLSTEQLVCEQSSYQQRAIWSLRLDEKKAGMIRP